MSKGTLASGCMNKKFSFQYLNLEKYNNTFILLIHRVLIYIGMKGELQNEVRVPLRSQHL